MTKYKIISPIILLAVFLAFSSCKGGKKQAVETKEIENIPEDIVELSGDQAKLADISIGAIELRTLSGTLKVNGTVQAAPQNMATVEYANGRFCEKYVSDARQFSE
jgi:cobalt-zinc-cadmium efflux system membrane fusion protein